jgi:DNA-binding transcriptional MocR family regulator
LIRDDVDGHVVTVTSLTKAAAPSLRIGAIAAQGPVLQRVAAMRLVDDFFVSRPLQGAAIELVTSAGWQTHLRSLAAALRQRYQVLARSLARYMPECSFRVPGGGLYLWLRLPHGADEDAVVNRALALGVNVNTGRLFTIGETDTPYLRVSFAAIDVTLIEEAVRRLSRAIGG